MPSKQQTRANRKNAQRSTGPRTEAGKAKSSKNALKHGLRAQATVLPDENLDEFELLVSELEDQFQPQSAIEWTLLRQLADAEWRMRRVPCLEAGLFAAKLNETVRYYQEHPGRLPEDDDEAEMILIGRATERDANNGDTFSKLSRYESRLSHRYFKALEQLQKLQSPRQQSAAPGNQAPTAPSPDNGAGRTITVNGPSAIGGNRADGDKADEADGDCYQVLPAKTSGANSKAPKQNLLTVPLARNAPQPQPAPNSTTNPIAKGDPSPVRKGRAHTKEPATSPAPVPAENHAQTNCKIKTCQPKTPNPHTCAKRTQSRLQAPTAPVQSSVRQISISGSSSPTTGHARPHAGTSSTGSAEKQRHWGEATAMAPSLRGLRRRQQRKEERAAVSARR